jgi:thiamine kinase-like enzyme
VNGKNQVRSRHERGPIGLVFQETFGGNGGQKGNSKSEPKLLEGLRRFIDGRSIEAALPPELRRRGVALDNYERIGGITNRNYKLHVGGETLVLRLPGRGTGRFINRSTERANHEVAARWGFTPPSVYFNGRTGVKITRYLEDARALDPIAARRSGTISDVALLLSRFHGSGMRFVNDFDVFRLARIYERVARGRFARLYEGFSQIKARIFLLERPLAVEAGEKVACHNDLVPENILETGSDLTLIDWEYSGMNDPAWDLASFTLESGYEADDEARFLSTYYGGPVPERLRIRVEAYRLLQDYLWSLWSLLQESSSREPDKARGYREYGQDRFMRAQGRLDHVEVRFGIARSIEVHSK